MLDAYVSHVERSAAYTTPAYPYQRAPYLNHNVSYAANVALVDAFSPGSSNVTVHQMAQRFRHNLPGMVITLGEIVSDGRGFWQYELSLRSQRFPALNMISPWLFYLPLILLGGLSLAGMVVLIRRREVLIPVYILTSVMLLCATPWPEQFRRYLVPLIPFLLTSLFTCVLGIGHWLRTFRSGLIRSCAPLPVMLVLVLIFDAELKSLHAMYRFHLDRVRSATYDGTLIDYRLFYYNAPSESLDDGLDWLKMRAKPFDVVATSMPHWAYLRKGLKAVRPPLEANRERAQALLDSVPVTYIVLNFKSEMQFVNKFILPLVEGDAKAWTFVYTDDKGLVRIYERTRSPLDKAKQ